MNTVKKAGKALRKFIIFIKAYLIGKIMYSNDYFPKGEWFKTWKSIGYEWVISDFWGRLIYRRNRGIPWPVSPYCNVANKNVNFSPDDIDNFQSFGTYYQTWDASITIGEGTYIAQGVGLITSNHDVYDLDKRSKASDIIIGKKCWIGINAVILPGVILGDHTVVGAGAVVTKSFPQGFCVVAGNPAVVIKNLDKEQFLDLEV